MDGHRKDTKLWKIIWNNGRAIHPSEAFTYMGALRENIHPEILAEYEAGLQAEAQLDAEEAAALEGDEEE